MAAILSDMVVSSCASDEHESPGLPTDGKTKVGLTVSAAPLAGNTRGFDPGDLTESTPTYNELIVNWFVAFCQNGNVVKTVTGNPGGEGTSGATGVWNDRIETELSKGTYTVVAFANMNNAKLSTKFVEGSPLPVGWKEQVFDSDLIHTDTDRIPMSGYKENVTIRQTVNEEFAIEVVRMLCKVQFAVKNESSAPVSVTEITLQPVYDDDIFVFPDYTTYGGTGRPTPDTQEPATAPRYPKTEYNVVKRSVTPDITNLAIGNIQRETFYIKESIAEGNHPTDHFHIGLKIKRGTDATAPENVTYALADDNLKFFYRNDYVLFPILISDYIPELEVYDYPPIGGYPVQVESNGSEFYATFSSSGAFDVVARLRNSQGQTVAIEPYKEGAAQNNYVRLVSVAPESVELDYEPALGEWQGNFDYQPNDNKRIILIFEFKIGNLLYTRTLYLLS